MQLNHRLNMWFCSFSLFVCIQLLFELNAQGAQLKAVAAVSRGNQTVALKTNEEGVFFLVPLSWKLIETKTHVTQIESERWRLRMTFSPDYSASVPFIVETKAILPDAVFLPLPIQIKQQQLFLEGLEAETDFESSPLASASGSFLYFSISLNAEQFNVLSALDNGGASITGSVEYKCGDETLGSESSAALIAHLNLQDLIRGTPQDYGLEWLGSLLVENHLLLRNVLDTEVSLGRVSVFISQSLLKLKLRPETFHLSRAGTQIRLKTLATNADITISFEVSPLGLIINMSAEALVECELDMTSLKFKVTKLELKNVHGSEGQLSPIIVELLNNQLLTNQTLQKISEKLENELGERILQASLFLP
jgi:hypothetical protein